MTKLKIDGQPAHAAAKGLEAHVAPLYARLGRTVVAVVELRAVERTQVDATSGKDTAVKVRMTGCEVATGKSEDHLREVQQALHTLRTAAARDEGMLDGVLDFDRTIDLAESTVRQASGLVMVEENARLVAGVRQLRRLLFDLSTADLSKTTPTKYRDRVSEVAQYAFRLEQLALDPDGDQADDRDDGDQ
jgi:hypothetical protein